MRKVSVVLVGAIAFSSLGYVGSRLAAEQKKPLISTSEKPRINADLSKLGLNVGVVNLTKVFKEFNSANWTGDKILEAAKEYEMELKAEKEKLEAEQKRVAALSDGDEKDEANKAVRQGQAVLQEKDAKCQKIIRKRRDEMAIHVNKQIQDEIERLARDRGLELVLTCPDVPTKEEEGSLTDAMRRMTAPAVWVAWRHPNLDITSELIAVLNRKYPPPKN